MSQDSSTSNKKARKVVYPGTFDPPHLGHLDLIFRGRELFDEVVVAVAKNRQKNFTFSEDERVELLEKCIAGREGIRVTAFDGLVVDLLDQQDADCFLRGIRTFSDFEAEYTMALTNRQMTEAETIFVLPTLEYSHYSSRLIKEIASFGGDIGDFLPEEIRTELSAELKNRLGFSSD